MAANLGTSSALIRVGSGLPSKVFLGTVSILNVPGQPTMIESCADVNSTVVFFPPADGGSAILDYEVYVDNDTVDAFAGEQYAFTGPVNDPNSPAGSLTITFEDLDFAGLDVTVRARNAIGYGPFAADVVAQVC